MNSGTSSEGELCNYPQPELEQPTRFYAPCHPPQVEPSPPGWLPWNMFILLSIWISVCVFAQERGYLHAPFVLLFECPDRCYTKVIPYCLCVCEQVSVQADVCVTESDRVVSLCNSTCRSHFKGKMWMFKLQRHKYTKYKCAAASSVIKERKHAKLIFNLGQNALLCWKLIIELNVYNYWYTAFA